MHHFRYILFIRKCNKVLPENKTKATITDRSTTKMLTRPRARLPIVPAIDRQTDRHTESSPSLSELCCRYQHCYALKTIAKPASIVHF